MVPDSAVIKHVIQQHQVCVMKSDDEDVQRINIRRSQVLLDSLRQFRKTSFNVEKLLKVCFIVEEAVDARGPRREFLNQACGRRTPGFLELLLSANVGMLVCVSAPKAINI